MGFPPPQYNTPLLPDAVPVELPYYPIYGVTPSNKYTPISIDSMGRLNTNATLTGSVTIGEIGSPDETSFSFGASLEQTIGGVYQDTNPTLPSGTQGAVRITQYRAFHTNLRDSSGIELSSTAGVLNTNVLSLPLPPNAAKETGGNLDSINAGIETLNSLVPSVFDYIALSYTTGNLTQAVYKNGGAGGTVVSTLDIAYDVDNNIISVTRS